ncbi:glycosyltransferase family 4 protein [Parabacteroides sp. APC149_11_2_Y6]
MNLVVIGTRGIPYIMGGVETHCEELFPRIVEKGINVTVFRRKNYVHDNLTKWNGVKLIDIKTPKKKSFEAIIHTFKAILKAKAIKADIVHIHAIGPALLVPIARLLGMKVVFTHHGMDYDRDKWGRIAKIMLKLGECMGTLFANEVIVISKVIYDLLVRKYGRKDCHLIYNGVPQPEICECLDYFEELGVKKKEYILCTCRFVPEKNLHHLIEAYVSLRESKTISSNMKLVLAGDTDFEDNYSLRLKEMARKNGIVLTGFIKGDKLHSLLTNACCYCLPSSHEGLPIALLEAMSYRLPVVVSNIPANMEIGLNENSYFPCGDIEQLIKKLGVIASQPLQRVTYDIRKYDWDYIALQVKNVYDKLMPCDFDATNK